MSKICDERPVGCGDPACPCREFSARTPSESPAATEGAAGFLESAAKNVPEGATGSGIGISDDADLRQRARISRAIDNWIVEENAKRGRETVFPLEHPPLRSLAELAAQGHILHTEDDCGVFHAEDLQCPVCEGGLAVCAVCGEYESGLDKPCQPRNPDYWNGYRAGRIDALEKFNEDLVELVRIRRERMEQ